MGKLCLLILLFVAPVESRRFYLPVHIADRTNPESITLTNIGQYGVRRKARPTVPAHYHTGIDIKRPGLNYSNEPVYAVGKGKVISVRNDGPFSQIIVEHTTKTDMLWSVYEHVLGITCHVGDIVTENTVIARFFNKAELDKYGWQFDHLHFEILKTKPLKVRHSIKFPEYYYQTYAITCFTIDDLCKRTINPMEYFKNHMSRQ